MKGWDNCPRCGGTGFSGILMCNDEAPPTVGRLYIAEEWVRFARMCIPYGAPDEQRQSMRDAFYAGAKSLFATMESEVSNEDEATPEDLRVMVMLATELQAYGEELAARAQRNREKRKGAGGI